MLEQIEKMTAQCLILKWNDMEKCEKNLHKTTEKPEKTDETAQEEQEYTEALHRIIIMRKGMLEEKQVWFGTVGNQLVSDGAYSTKQELIENLENVTLERVCKIVAAAFERAIIYNEKKK